MKNRLLTKVSNIDDISVSVEYFKDKYYPDILKEVDLLESLVEQIKEEPRILYDENYSKFITLSFCEDHFPRYCVSTYTSTVFNG